MTDEKKPMFASAETLPPDDPHRNIHETPQHEYFHTIMVGLSAQAAAFSSQVIEAAGENPDKVCAQCILMNLFLGTGLNIVSRVAGPDDHEAQLQVVRDMHEALDQIPAIIAAHESAGHA